MHISVHVHKQTRRLVLNFATYLTLIQVSWIRFCKLILKMAAHCVGLLAAMCDRTSSTASFEFGRAVNGSLWPKSSRGRAVWRSPSLAPSSCWVSPAQHGQGAEMGQRRCCLLPRLACRIWLCELVRQHSRSQALETTPRLQGRSLLFCLTLTGRMNTTPPSCPSQLPLLPWALSQKASGIVTSPFLVTLLLQTHTHNPSISREHSH